MSLLHGKQIKDLSISLDKLSGNGSVSILGGSSMTFATSSSMTFDTGAVLTLTDLPTAPLHAANKEYVDSIASGLDTKESAMVILTGTTAEATILGAATASGPGGDGVGATLTFTNLTVVDGYTLVVGDRVVVNGTLDYTKNGVYEVTSVGAGAVLTRTTDFDDEVNGGEYVFIKAGDSYKDTGWVVSTPDGPITVGADPIIFTQFSSAGVITVGPNGLVKVGNVIDIDVTGVTAGGYGALDTVPTFLVNAQGQLEFAEDVVIGITSGQVTDFVQAAKDAVIDPVNFVNGTTIEFTVATGSTFSAEVIDTSLEPVKLAATNGASAADGMFLGLSGGSFYWQAVSIDADITDVFAGEGLTGGGTFGGVTLSLSETVAGAGLTYAAGVINIIGSASNTANITVDVDSITANVLYQDSDTITFTEDNLGLKSELRYTSTDTVTLGTGPNGLSASINIDPDGGLTSSALGIALEETVAGAGLTYALGVMDVLVNSDSIEILNDEVRLKDVITGPRVFEDNLQTNGNMFVAGDLTVSGTVSYLNTTELLIEDSYITLNSGLTSGPGIDGGIEVLRGGSTAASILWNEGNGLWEMGLSGSTEAVVLNAGSGLAKTGATLSVDLTSLADGLSGEGLTAIAGTINVGTVDTDTLSFTVSTDAISADLRYADTSTIGFTASALNGLQAEVLVLANGGLTATLAGLGVDESIAGAGLTYTAGVVNVGEGLGMIVDADVISVRLDGTQSGLTYGATTSGIEISPTIAGAGLSYNAGVLSVVGGVNFPVYEYLVPDATYYGNATAGAPTNIVLGATPSEYFRVEVLVNGQRQKLAYDSALTFGDYDCWFGDATTIISLDSLSAADVLVWNSQSAGFRLEATDNVQIVYQA